MSESKIKGIDSLIGMYEEEIKYLTSLSINMDAALKSAEPRLHDYVDDAYKQMIRCMKITCSWSNTCKERYKEKILQLKQDKMALIKESQNSEQKKVRDQKTQEKHEKEARQEKEEEEKAKEHIRKHGIPVLNYTFSIPFEGGLNG